MSRSNKDGKHIAVGRSARSGRHLALDLMRPLVLSLLSMCISGLPASAALQSWSQHGELVARGTITDVDGTVWNVRFIPGTRKINGDAADGWRDAGSAMAELGAGELWQETLPDAFFDGIDFSEEVAVEHFAEGISNDVRSASDQNRELRRGDFGRGFIVTWNWTKATCTVFGRTVWLPIGMVGGATYSLVAPVLIVTWRPIESLGYATTTGMLVPMLVHLWNGTAWGATFFNSVPERETRWVKRLRAPTEYVLDATRLEVFLEASVEEHLNAEQSASARAEADHLQGEINQLRREQRAHIEVLEQLQRELENSRAVQDREQLQTGANSAQEVVLDGEAKTWLEDDDRLDAAIAAALNERGREPSDEEVRSVRKALRLDVDAVVRGR